MDSGQHEESAASVSPDTGKSSHGGRANGYDCIVDTFSDSHSSAGSCKSVSKRSADDASDNASSEEDENKPLPPDRPSSHDAEQEQRGETETERHFKSLLYGGCKARSDQPAMAAPTPSAFYTTQFSVCPANISPSHSVPAMQAFTMGMLPGSKSFAAGVAAVCTAQNNPYANSASPLVSAAGEPLYAASPVSGTLHADMGLQKYIN